MKRILTVLLAFALIISCVECVFANSNMDADRQLAIDNLLSAGWTMDEINDYLSDDALLVFKDMKGVVSSSQKYYKVNDDGVTEVSESQCVNALDTIRFGASVQAVGDEHYDERNSDDGYMTYYVQAYDLGNNLYALSARYEWLTDPIYRYKDVFGLGHADNLTQIDNASDVYYVYKADISETMGLQTNHYVYETSVPTSISVDDGGTVVTQDLFNNITTSNPDNPLENYIVRATAHRGYIQYKVVVNSSAATHTSIHAEYLHQQLLFNVTPTISYPPGGSISLNYSYCFKRMSPNPYCSFPLI